MQATIRAFLQSMIIPKVCHLTDKDKSYYERKCERLDKEIDSEVYKLYDLTEEEIKIVEGKE